MKLESDPLFQGNRTLSLRSLPPQRSATRLSQAARSHSPRTPDTDSISYLCWQSYLLPSPTPGSWGWVTYMNKADHGHCFSTGHVTHTEPMRLNPKTFAGVTLQEEFSTRLMRWKPGSARHRLHQQVQRMKLTQRKAVSRDGARSPIALPQPPWIQPCLKLLHSQLSSDRKQ